MSEIYFACKCEAIDCENRIWTEEGTYWWVRFWDGSQHVEKQILREMNIERTIAFRDQLNEHIASLAGIKI